MDSLLTTILVLLLLYFGLKFLFRLARPFLMRYIAKKMTERFGQGAGPFQSYEQRPEGEVSIDKTPSQTKKSSEVVGEYIEYEEID